MTIAAIITWLISASKIMKETGADQAVKEGAKSVFSWLRDKFKRKSEQEKITTVEDSPEQDNAIRALEQLIADTQKDDEALFASLQEQLKQFSSLVQQKMPQAAAAINNQISNSKNVVTGNITDIDTGGGDFHIGDN